MQLPLNMLRFLAELQQGSTFVRMRQLALEHALVPYRADTWSDARWERQLLPLSRRCFVADLEQEVKYVG